MKIYIILFALLVVSTAFAAFTIPWNKMAGGGGKSTGTAVSGAVLTVEGTIGQFDTTAGGASGGGFSLNGGYWAQIIPSPTPNAPTLTLVPQPGGSFSLQWQSNAAGWQVQVSNDLGTWTNVGGIISTSGVLTVTPSVGVPKQFFRLLRP